MIEKPQEDIKKEYIHDIIVDKKEFGEIDPLFTLFTKCGNTFEVLNRKATL